MTDDPREFTTRNDRIFGERIARVETEAQDDPEKLLRIQVRVFGAFDTTPVKDLPWAEVKLPLGSGPNRGAGLIAAIKKGDYVWVDFPYNGDTRRPRITGSVHHAPEKAPDLPHETFAGDDVYAHQRTGEEPEAPAHEYGKDVVVVLHGVMVAINADGSYNLVQKSTGTETTITKDGDLIHHVEGNFYRSVTKDSKSVIDGDEKVLVMGAQETIAQGGITHDGGSSNAMGVVQGGCIETFTGKPFPDISANVKASK